MIDHQPYESSKNGKNDSLKCGFILRIDFLIFSIDHGFVVS
jgi:hypothetical protein